MGAAAAARRWAARGSGRPGGGGGGGGRCSRPGPSAGTAPGGMPADEDIQTILYSQIQNKNLYGHIDLDNCFSTWWSRPPRLGARFFIKGS